MPDIHYVAAALVGYLLGSIPFGYLVARAHGVDIFKTGSCNPGATNVKRVLGAKAGNTVFVLDVLKGSAASGWSLLSLTSASMTYDFEVGSWLPPATIAGESWRLMGLAGVLGAVMGHSFSLFTKFKGGKGVATTAGGVLVLMPIPCLIGGAVWLGTFYATRYVSLGSILAAITVPTASWLTGNPLPLTVVVALLSLFVIVRHRENISRLLAGTENKFARKGAAPDGPKPPAEG